ncbi:MAG: thioredoxin-disulfide reductase [Lachnospiraceae bacterium]|nr:thioredoxin-disulfide reductase [Lachnospiraceae bacterium]
MKDLIIIGSGPAGLTAAIYAKRAELDCVVIEKEAISGGQIINTTEIDNYPGLYHMGGFDLGMKFREHADALGAEFVEGNVVGFSRTDEKVTVTLENGDVYEAKTAIIAGGARHRELGVEGEARLRGAGVSYCATCDGAFFRKKITVVNGGGDVAVEDALFLSRLCEKVYLVHRRDEFRAAKTLVSAAKAAPNIEFVLDSVITEIKGDQNVSAITVKNVKTGEVKDLAVSGVFIAVGMLPESEVYKNAVDTDEKGYIIGDETGKTSAPNVFVAGDIRTKALRQVVTAAADGANAVTSVENYLHTLN